MSFDPITLAHAKNYTDEKVAEAGNAGGGNTGGGVSVVDLDQYGIGQGILALFANGGGEGTVSSLNAFWEAMSTDSDVHLTLVYTDEEAEESYTFRIAGVTRAFSSNICFNVSFAFTVADAMGNTYHISVMITRFGNGAFVSVKVA